MPTPEDLAPLDVLIAEDDEDVRRGIRLLLEGRGYRCAEAADGRAAVALALERSPRCLLLDLAMPVLDGLSVARTLRADPRTRGAHIHCVSGLVDAQSRREAREAGCELFLTKPVDPAALLEAVRGPAESASVSGLTLAEAEGLLDWLEDQGCTQLEVVLGDGGTTVRCHCPPGRYLVRAADGAYRLVPR